MRKTLSIILCLTLMLSMMIGIDITASANTRWEIGDDVVAVLDGDTLIVSGTGKMKDYDMGPNKSPFYPVYSNIDIKSIIVEDGVTSIGAASFACVSSLEYVKLAPSVAKINGHAFYDCSSLSRIDSYSPYCIVAENSAIPLNEGLLINAIDNSGIANFAIENSISFMPMCMVTFVHNDTTKTESIYCLNGTTVDELKLMAPANTYGPYVHQMSGTTHRHTVYKWKYGTITSITANTQIKEGTASTEVCTMISGTKAPTCAEAGYDYTKCKYCDYIEKTNITPTTEHIFKDYLFNNDATCTEDGTLTAKCENCDATDTIVAPNSAKGHQLGTPVTENEKKPTCASNGSYDEVFYCPDCGVEAFRLTHTTDKTGVHTYKTAVTTKATTDANGKLTTKCTVCGNIKSTTTINKISKTITLSKTAYVYDGNYKKPSVTVKDSKGNTIDPKYYAVSYSNNKAVGKATVKIVFKTRYSGTITKTFKINPKATSISSLTATKGGFKVAWKKKTTQTTGYQVQYATDSKFTKNKKTLTISKNTTTSKSVSKLTKGKKYYVRVRTYKTVNGTKYYSSWSGYKTITTKK